MSSKPRYGLSIIKHLAERVLSELEPLLRLVQPYSVRGARTFLGWRRRRKPAFFVSVRPAL